MPQELGSVGVREYGGAGVWEGGGSEIVFTCILSSERRRAAPVSGVNHGPVYAPMMIDAP